MKFTRPSKLVIGALIAGGLAILAAVLSVAGPMMGTVAVSPRAGGVTQSSGVALGMPSFAAPEIASDTSYATKGMMPIVPPSPSPTGGQTAAEADQKIIKTASLDLAVTSVDETIAKITALATGKGGYVQSSSANERDDGTKFGSITIRVPSTVFESTGIEIKKLATLVKSETASGQDVTEQYTDLQAQLRNAQAQEQEYLNILKKAQTVQDILNVQQYLSNIRGTIESLQGRIKYFSNLTSYSTFAITLSEDTVVKAPSQGFRPLEDARAAVQSLIVLGEALVSWLIWIVVVGGGILIPIALVVYLLYRLVRHFTRKSRL